MNTRTESMDGYVYCAYCGKELKNPHYGMCPEPPTICNCEKAKQELDLYDQLRSLYNAPIAESLIEKKVQKYRNQLLGIKEPTPVYMGSLGSTVCNGSYPTATLDQGSVNAVLTTKEEL